MSSTPAGRNAPGAHIHQIVCVLAISLICLTLAALKCQASPVPRIPLDPAFGNNGTTSFDFAYGFINVATSMLRQPDGKIIVIGYTDMYGFPSDYDMVSMTRLQTDGTVDTSFGNNGMVFSLLPSMNSVGSLRPLNGALLPDGRILLVGYQEAIGYPTTLRMARFRSDGVIDRSFGDRGMVIGPANYYANDLAVQDDGKILVTGRYNDSAFVKRFYADGEPDTSYGTNGTVLHAVAGRRIEIFSMSLQPDGKTIIAGKLDSLGSGPSNIFMGRFTVDGVLDSTFGSAGTVITDISGNNDEAAIDSLIQPDGKILLGGTAYDVSALIVLRYQPDGSPDPSFGTAGLVSTYFPPSCFGGSLALFPDGRIVIAGSGAGRFAIARYTAEGNLIDRSTTKVLTSGFGVGAAIQPDGKVLVAGTASATGQTYDFAVVRYMDTNVMPPLPAFDFDGDYRADIGVYRPGATAGDSSHWFILMSGTNTIKYEQFGLGEDKIVPADFNGDGKADVAVWRPSTGTWYLKSDQTGNVESVQWGMSGDTPLPGDFDGDGKSDLAVFRPGSNYWYIRRSSDGGVIAKQFGINVEQPLVGDLNSDGKADLWYTRIVNRWLIWYVDLGDGVTYAGSILGAPSDVPAPADYYGDGGSDLAAFRPTTGLWQLWHTITPNEAPIIMGTSGDIPASADYDGDERADITIFRPSEGMWYYISSSTGQQLAQQWGVAGDIPIASAYVQRAPVVPIGTR
jgi:uncharacterized delta-60 repeat protein